MRPAHAARFGQGSSHAGCPSVAGDLRAIRTTRSDAGSSFSRDHGRPQCHAPDKLPAVLTPASALVVLSPSVVRIVGYGSGALGVFGTGVALGTKGHILTSYEVVKDAEDVFVALGEGQGVYGQVVGLDFTTVLAIIQIESGWLAPQRP